MTKASEGVERGNSSTVLVEVDTGAAAMEIMRRFPQMEEINQSYDPAIQPLAFIQDILHPITEVHPSSLLQFHIRREVSKNLVFHQVMK